MSTARPGERDVGPSPSLDPSQLPRRLPRQPCHRYRGSPATATATAPKPHSIDRGWSATARVGCWDGGCLTDGSLKTNRTVILDHLSYRAGGPLRDAPTLPPFDTSIRPVPVFRTATVPVALVPSRLSSWGTTALSHRHGDRSDSYRITTQHHNSTAITASTPHLTENSRMEKSQPRLSRS